MRFVLASASPARLRSLRDAGCEPEVVVSGVDESAVEASTAVDLCGVLARMKATAVAARVEAPALVLGCDSVLEFEGQIFGKPSDAEEAITRWKRMRGRAGLLHTGHCLIDVGSGRRQEAVASTEVRFANITDEEIAAYVGTGEPLHVAGAFTIDGIGSWFLDGITGDVGTVIGVSLPLLRRMLNALNIPVSRLWRL